ncbi:cupin domain-containing protein [Flavicella marina]|uniref:cupin domain-containing protein n=1 Tax=Flavicella marina TaxID=1475951 RepID=UPI00126570EA|nr:cupin domain-containing protein [Flavicella marina]
MKLIHTDLITEVTASHNSPVAKKVFLDDKVIPKIMQFGAATFKPGQKVERHKHDTMYEVFYIQSGKIDFEVGGASFTLIAGDCITIEPGEIHAQNNSYGQDVIWLYFGIATD